MENVDNPILIVLNKTFNQSFKNEISNYKNKTDKITKWTCYSDYCLDDPNKPNSVITFTLIPYIESIEDFANNIKTLANKDIKKIKNVNPEFLKFIMNYPLINISFIVNDRKNLFLNNAEKVNFLKNTLNEIKKNYVNINGNNLNDKDYYLSFLKKIDCVIKLLDKNKKIKQISDMFLVTFLGTYISSWIVNKEILEIIGWFSDRDAINEVCENFSIDLFNYYMQSFCYENNFNVVASLAGSNDNAFYEELVRIPDYIAGTLADFDMDIELISKSKFDTILTEYMAENSTNNFVFKLANIDGTYYCNRICYYKK